MREEEEGGMLSFMVVGEESSSGMEEVDMVVGLCVCVSMLVVLSWPCVALEVLKIFAVRVCV